MVKANHTMSLFRADALDKQLQIERRAVDFDTFDIHTQQLLTMLEEGQVYVAPAYQRQFRWDDERCSQLIESLMLGIPVPSLFMATNPDSTWEVVDGVQRLSSIVKFAGGDKLRSKLGIVDELRLSGLKKLTEFDGLTFSELSSKTQNHFKTRPLKVVTLNDKSDMVVRYDLFERLNRGGVLLSDQEIRKCIFQGDFSKYLERLAKVPAFKKVVRLQKGKQRDGTAEECVLRFFAFLHNYMHFDHSVIEFLNDYMEKATKGGFDYQKNEALFVETFKQLERVFPNGLTRPGKGAVRRTTTPLNLFEGVSVGAALAIQKSGKLNGTSVNKWIASDELAKFTKGATNSKTAVAGRIHFCRDRFLGKPYVPEHPKGN